MSEGSAQGGEEMKKIGDAITMLGQVTVNTNGHEIRLWDGSFRTGFRVTKFIISIEAPTGAYEAVGKLHTFQQKHVFVFNISKLCVFMCLFNFQL